MFALTSESAYPSRMKTPFFLPLVFLVSCMPPQAETISQPVNNIYWSDGDSGRIDGMKFRLANIDAPETGGVGAIGGAKCELERERGFEAKAFVVELTRDSELEITARYGPDRYDREVIDLSADGVDVGEAGIIAGHLGTWPHKGRKALSDKPDWCGLP